MIDIAALSVHGVSSSTILIDRANEKRLVQKQKYTYKWVSFVNLNIIR